MNLDTANKWLSVIANFGVVAGIIFLAIELRQNHELLERDYALARLDSASLDLSRHAAHRSFRIQSREVAQLWLDGIAGNELDPVDQSRFMAMCTDFVWQDALLYVRSNALGIDAYVNEVIVLNKRNIAQRPGLRACWEARRDGLRKWGYGDYVDAIESQ